MKPNTVIRIGSQYYRLRYKDTGFPHPDDKGLWRALKVEWDPVKGEFGCHDDDDWMISEDKLVIAREVGWDCRRFKPTDWGFKNYR